MFQFYKTLDVEGLRHAKFISFRNKHYLIGSKKYKQQGDVTKYALQLFEVNEHLEICNDAAHSNKYIELDEYPYLEDIAQSCWVRDVYVKNDELYLNIEIKQNINNETFCDNNFLIKTTDCDKFHLVKQYIISDFLFKDFDFKDKNYILTAKIEKEAGFFWGKYLFNFIIDKQEFQPIFDDIVDYNSDKGHLLHQVEYDAELNSQHAILFSIRHKTVNGLQNDYLYKIYSANTNDFIHFTDTKEVEFSFDKNKLNSNWFSYPHKFTLNHEEYIVCNQDDFGKNSLPVIFKNGKLLETFVSKLYNNGHFIYRLNFSTNAKYIYYDELTSKSGKRYEDIVNNKRDLKEYSNYSPSCTKLFHLLKRLNIGTNDSILDIGCGRGYALAVFNRFPFDKISGIEICETDVNICIENIHAVLGLTNTQIINDNILNFNAYNQFNYFYFYNPFDSELFNIILSNISSSSFVIYKNIHENERKQLKVHHFELIMQEKGDDRDYYVFKKTV
jgi:hypothetical protein